MGQCHANAPSKRGLVFEPYRPEANPPQWGPNVHVFCPSDSSISQVVNQAYGANGNSGGSCNHGQFSEQRFAFLFKPGTYAQDVPVGFYTTVAGLGSSPDDVQFTGLKGVHCPEACPSDPHNGALCTFWRSAENFQTHSTAWGGMLWAVSQASPLRRVRVKHNLVLQQDGGYASGGFLADSLIEGQLSGGGQQQWMSRNVKMGSWSGFVWNYVFVGCEGAPPSGNNISNVGKTPVIAEKPFITVDSSSAGDKFSLQVPPVRNASAGPSWLQYQQKSRQIPFENVYVARSGIDTACTINAKLACRSIEAVVMTPGIYHLDEALNIVRNDQVVLGLGMATLVPTAGTPAICIAKNIGGVRVAGLLLQAGPIKSPTLLDWCASDKTAAVSFVHDLFARVGGPSADQVEADSMVHIKGCNVVGDNLWLWRADHYITGETREGQFPCQNGLVVDGDDVTMYGLAVEHTLADLTVWNGNGGSTYFYQSELPYDVSSFNSSGYKVSDKVTSHQGYGVGVYHFFRDHPVAVQSAIQCPRALLQSFENSLTVHLSGQGTIKHVINDVGQETGGYSQVARVHLAPATYKDREAITYIPNKMMTAALRQAQQSVN